jgi:hypothetical protein
MAFARGPRYFSKHRSLPSGQTSYCLAADTEAAGKCLQRKAERSQGSYVGRDQRLRAAAERTGHHIPAHRNFRAGCDVLHTAYLHHRHLPVAAVSIGTDSVTCHIRPHARHVSHQQLRPWMSGAFSRPIRASPQSGHVGRLLGSDASLTLAIGIQARISGPRDVPVTTNM